MKRRRIVQIDEEKCTGCGLCIPNCAEGALQIINGKAKLITDKFCDGLGACLGYCPEGAIRIIEREAEEFDEKAVEIHLHQKKEAIPFTPFGSEGIGCPSSGVMQFQGSQLKIESDQKKASPSQLTHWPVQLRLVPVDAPYFKDADLLVVADCVPFAYPRFHEDFLKGRTVVIGCPKLDDIQLYREKLKMILRANSIKSITIPYMEVPCCFGLVKAVEEATEASGKNIPIQKMKIGIRGEIRLESENKRLDYTPTFAHSL